MPSEGEFSFESEQQNKFAFKKELFDWVEALVFAILAVVLLNIFVFRIVTVIGTSMVPTLYDGDRVIISNLFYEPEASDIVILNKENFTGKPFVKRIIATEGQTVDIDYDTGTLTVDGQVVKEDYINETMQKPGDVELPYTVPDGEVFVMGDNRNHSTDSRYVMIGPVDTRNIMGRAIVRIFPLNTINSLIYVPNA